MACKTSSSMMKILDYTTIIIIIIIIMSYLEKRLVNITTVRPLNIVQKSIIIASMRPKPLQIESVLSKEPLLLFTITSTGYWF